jgi:hypothetical protein
MKHLRKGIWFPVALVLIIITIALWFPFKYGYAFIYNHRLLKKGVVEHARVVKKGIMVNKELVWATETRPSSDHQLLVRLSKAGIEPVICQFGVSKSLYDDTSPGERISVMFLTEEPEKCKLYYGIDGTQKILMAGFGLSSLMIFIAFGSMFFIRRSYRRPGPGNSSYLTTEMECEGDLYCQQCSEKMAEGYLPMGFGIHWRSINHPVGIPNIFGVLPGTMFWLKRPKLHAFHCEKCRIVTFKYGKK